MKNDMNSDITGLASLDSPYQMKAKEFEHLPDDDNKIDAMVKSGVDLRTALLVMKAKAVREAQAKSAATGRPVNPSTVEQDIEAMFAHYKASHPQVAQQGKGIPSVPLPEDMFQGGYAEGGIVAFEAGGLNDPDTVAGVLGQPPMRLDAMRPVEASQVAGVDPALVSKWMNYGYGQRGPLDATVSGIASMGYNPEKYLGQIRADRANAASVANQLRPNGNEADYQERSKQFAIQSGMNEGEADTLVGLAKYRDDMDKYYANEPVSNRALAKSSADIRNTAFDAYKNHMPLSNMQGAMLAFGILGGNQINAASEAQKALSDAHLDTTIKAAAAKEAMTKNLISTRSEGAKEFKDAMFGWNDAQKREDELDKYITTAQTGALTHNQQMKVQAATINAYARNPGVAYQPMLDALEQRQAEAEARGPAGEAEVAAIKEAKDRILARAQGAVKSTTSGYAATLSAEARIAAANIASVTRERVAAMNDGQLKALEAQYAPLLAVADTGDSTLNAYKNNLAIMIASRKAELAAMSNSAPGAAAPAAAPAPGRVVGYRQTGQ